LLNFFMQNLFSSLLVLLLVVREIPCSLDQSCCGVVFDRCSSQLLSFFVLFFCGDFFSFLLFFCTEILDLLDPAASSTGVLLLSFLFFFFWFCEDFFSFLLFCCTLDCFFVGSTGVQLSSIVLEIKRGRNLYVMRFFSVNSCSNR
jgi:hypothetical protein